MGDKAAPPPEKGGRYGLPGIPSYVDRVSQEKIYTDKIIGEEKYMESRKEVQIGDHKKSMGLLKGFEIIKFPTYVEVRKVYNQQELEAKPEFKVEDNKPKSTTSRKPIETRIMEARAECNRTAPTYAYKYFSEKHMETKRGGAYEQVKPKTMADLNETAKDLPDLDDVMRVPERKPAPIPNLDDPEPVVEPATSKSMLVQNSGTQTPKQA
mmetsp:Transcript_8513/g.20561  ORF Transcript_8513/g.20561 Transcript_8513/m.20561 type:complete len:210 (+) Transcript_8513:94-723(+)|eukprot:CAMPEP_0178996684 /NCGR_PEP_ID=MMETSP0795-20121207/8504_1 /TAXON_ID=88552 /ORGANISM="Amoebophrya sp., Strain Ameob2" /LENGTH=209 /DNA_ID=CAMNT_0020689099 /DNA_START=30 /DNA_END=659 /DNA_ORIENTATION=+